MTPAIPRCRVRFSPELSRVNTDDPAECVKQMLRAARDMELDAVVNILTSHDEEFFRNNINDTDSTGRVSIAYYITSVRLPPEIAYPKRRIPFDRF